MPKYADKLPDIDPAIEPYLEDYEGQMADLIDQARRGEIDRAEFEQRLRQLMEAFLILLFLRAGGSLTVAGAQKEMDELQAAHGKSVKKLADDVYNGRYQPTPEKPKEETDRALGSRLLLWLFGLAAAWSIGQAYNANQGKRYKWVLGATEQHCGDCARLAGQVHTAAEWRRSGWRPRIRRLECNGYRCDCRLVETEEQTRGNF